MEDSSFLKIYFILYNCISFSFISFHFIFLLTDVLNIVDKDDELWGLFW